MFVLMNMPPRVDLTGRVYGKLTVTGLAGKRGNTYQWNCICECGGSSVVDVSSLNAGRTRSCGCSAGFPKKHGKYGTRVYRAWVSMLQRCQNPNARNYANYGGRGISVCSRWRTFTNFLDDMGEPDEGQSLDRIDNEGNYELNNCRWTTIKRQRRNTRKTLRVEYEGREVVFADLWDAGHHKDVSYSLAWQRIVKLGWPVENALHTPRRKKKR